MTHSSPPDLSTAASPIDSSGGPVPDATRTHDPHTTGLPPTDPDATPDAGRVVAGRYHLRELLGEGGMGTVWLADQTQPIRRAVAVKLIRPGMDSRQVLARFEAERQALALMDHPNIARVLDAGTTDEGRPFFVMELVKGTPITEFCDAGRLSPRERLELFVPVCQAIQHAHQKGVIHRDIKPSNVLVELHDRAPLVKVIDFGVAKAVGPVLTDRTLATGLGSVIGTPAYMSPEQADSDALDVDTRSDVYALGVLLYELLTGTTPIERERFKKAALLDVLRAVREEDAPKPSTRVSGCADRAAVADARRTEPSRLVSLLRGDLDWIVMRCLEKDRTRRYETANGLAADVLRYLADEPVSAGPPSRWYRARKFLRRNRVTATAAGVVAAALVVGVIGTSLGMLDADRSRRQAESDRQSADAARIDAERDRDAKRIALGEAEQARAAAQAARAAAEKAKTDAEGARADAERDRDEKGKALRRSDGLRLAAEAQLARPTDPGLSLLLGAEAVRRYRHHLTFQALADAADACHEVRTIPAGLAEVRILKVSPDGRRALVAGAGGGGGSARSAAAAVIELASGKVVSRYRGYHSRVADADWSPDGRTAAVVVDDSVTVAYSDGQSPDRATFTPRVAYVWDTTTGREVAHLRGHTGHVLAVRFSPDGRRILTTSDDGTARVWDAATGKSLHVLGVFEGALLPAEFSPDGRRVLTVSSRMRREPRGFDPSSVTNPDPGLTDRIGRWAGSSSRGKSFRIGGGADIPEERFARLWDTETGREVGVLSEKAGPSIVTPSSIPPVQSVAWSPDGSRVAVGFGDGRVRVWDAARGEELPGAAPVRPGAVRSVVRVVAFAPDGASVAAGWHDGSVRVLDARSGEIVATTAGHQGPVLTAQFTPDGRRVLTTSEDGTARVWGASSGAERAAFRGHKSAVWAGAFLDDGRTVVTVGDATVRSWSVAQRSVATPLTAAEDPPLARLLGLSSPKFPIGRVDILSFSPDGSRILAAGQHPTAGVWNPETGQEVAALGPLQGGVAAAFFEPGGRSAVVGIGSGTYSLPGGQVTGTVFRWEPGRRPPPLLDLDTGVMRLEAGGDRLLTVSSGVRGKDGLIEGGTGKHEVRVWEAKTGRPVSRMEDMAFVNGPTPFARLSPDGRWVVLLAELQGNAQFGRYDAATGRRTLLFELPDGSNAGRPTRARELSPDGKTLVADTSGRGDGVQFWEVATGRHMGTWRVPGKFTCGRLAFDPNSTRVAVAHGDTVSVVRLDTRATAQTLRGHQGEVTAVAFSSDGRQLLTGSKDRTTALWDAATGEILCVYPNHPGPVRAIAHAPDGGRVATAADDPGSRVWPADTLPAYERLRPREFTPEERRRYGLESPADSDGASHEEAVAHTNRGVALKDRGDLAGAVAAYREAIRLDPKYEPAHFNLGLALHARNDLDGALVAYQEAVRLNPKSPVSYFYLGNLFRQRGRLDDAEWAYREAVDLDGDHRGAAIDELGHLLRSRGRLDAAVAAYRDAVRLDPQSPSAHEHLGAALRDRGDLDAAVAAFTEAVRLDPKTAVHQTNLQRAERWRVLAARLPDVAAGRAEPATAAEALEFAELCEQPFQGRFSAAVRLYETALAAEPKLTDTSSFSQLHRYNAACYAARAARGDGVDAPAGPAERAVLRAKAMAWLRADLAAHTKRAASPDVVERKTAADKLTHWLGDPDLTAVRTPVPLPALPADEAEAWRAFWADVRATRDAALKPPAAPEAAPVPRAK